MDPAFERRLCKLSPSPLKESPRKASTFSPVNRFKYGDRFISTRESAKVQLNFNLEQYVQRPKTAEERLTFGDQADATRQQLLGGLLMNELMDGNFETVTDLPPPSPVSGSHADQENRQPQRHSNSQASSSSSSSHAAHTSSGPSAPSASAIAHSGSSGSGGVGTAAPSTAAAGQQASQPNPFLSSISPPRRTENLLDFRMVAYETSSFRRREALSLCPLTPASQKLLQSPRRATRKIPRSAYKVLDAPDLQDDFYLNLVDWSPSNMLSVGLGVSVYLWNAANGAVVKLTELERENNQVTSVAWCRDGSHLAVGTASGSVQVWDCQMSAGSPRYLTTLEGHSGRVGSMAWSADLLTTGSRDRVILQRDALREPGLVPTRRLSAHKQEVCGLQWSPDEQLLASGGNDNSLFVWSRHSQQPILSFTQHHRAAVKAIAWSPLEYGLLASGGGTADRCIRFWNTLTGQPLTCRDTGSQVCNLVWSRFASELVSTHGYSHNQILVWRYPHMVPLARLTGHTQRVLYLSMSPDGESIVTGAGDETLRFWSVFARDQGAANGASSSLNLLTQIR